MTILEATFSKCYMCLITSMILKIEMCHLKEVLVAQLCLTLCYHRDCSPPGSSVHGIFQAGILDWVAFPLPGELLDLGTEPASLASLVLAGRVFTTVSPGKPP